MFFGPLIPPPGKIQIKEKRGSRDKIQGYFETQSREFWGKTNTASAVEDWVVVLKLLQFGQNIQTFEGQDGGKLELRRVTELGSPGEILLQPRICLRGNPVQPLKKNRETQNKQKTQPAHTPPTKTSPPKTTTKQKKRGEKCQSQPTNPNSNTNSCIRHIHTKDLCAMQRKTTAGLPKATSYTCQQFFRVCIVDI